MVRERIILSDLDIKLMNFLKEEHIVNDLINEFNLSFSQAWIHCKRLEKLNCINIKKDGNFKRMKLNKKGNEIIGILKWDQ